MIELIEMIEKHNTLITINYDHGKLSEVVKRRDMGDAWGGRCKGGIGNAVNEYLHRETAGNRGLVGGATSPI